MFGGDCGGYALIFTVVLLELRRVEPIARAEGIGREMPLSDSDLTTGRSAQPRFLAFARSQSIGRRTVTRVPSPA
jgi:hypothetical protein